MVSFGSGSNFRQGIEEARRDLAESRREHVHERKGEGALHRRKLDVDRPRALDGRQLRLARAAGQLVRRVEGPVPPVLRDVVLRRPLVATSGGDPSGGDPWWRPLVVMLSFPCR